MGKSHDLATLKDDGGRLGASSSDTVFFGTRGTLLSSDTHISHNLYWNGSAWTAIDSSEPSSTIRLGSDSGTSNEIKFQQSAAGSNNTILTRMTIDASGRVTMPYQPAFLAYNAPSISASNYRIYSQTLCNIGSAYSTSNGRFTAPVAGRYLFAFSDLITTPSTSTYAWTRPYLNGSHYTITVHTSYQSSRSYEPLGATYIADMDAGDYMQLYTGISGSSTYAGQYTWFSGHLIG